MYKLIVTILVLILCVPPVGAAFRYLDTGMKPPPIDGIDLISGQHITENQIIGKKVSIIVFWATWSNRSLEQLEDLQKLFIEKGNENLSILAVNVESQSGSKIIEDKIREKVAELNLSFPCIYDKDLSLFYEFGVIAVPSTAIMDSTGILRYAPAGYSYGVRDRIIDSIAVLLGEKLPTADTLLATGYQADLGASRFYGLARRLLNQRLYEDALANVRNSIEKDSLFASPYYLRGVILLKLDSIDAAIQAFSAAIKLDSTSTTYWAGLGESYLIKGDVDSANYYLDHALGLDSSYTPALMNKADALTRANLNDSAVFLLNSAIELSPMEPLIYYHLGKTYKSKGQDGQAALYLQKGLDLIIN